MKVPDHDAWRAIVSLLRNTQTTITTSSLRERFGTNRPDEIIKSERINAERFAEANWLLAKKLYCENKDYFDELSTKLNDEGDESQLFKAMKQVVEEEMVQTIETNILKEDV